MMTRTFRRTAGVFALGIGLAISPVAAAHASVASDTKAASAAAATDVRVCMQYLRDRFDDFDGGDSRDGLVSPQDIRRMGWLLPADCVPQLTGDDGGPVFRYMDTVRGGQPDGLISPPDIDRAIYNLTHGVGW